MSSPSATKSSSDRPSPSPTPPGDESFPKSRRLLRRADFQRVYREGRRFHGSLFTLHLLTPSPADGPRVGLTVSRKVGGAVVRNRIKRLLRESVRRAWQLFPPSCDCVFHAKPASRDATFSQVQSEVERVLRKASRDA